MAVKGSPRPMPDWSNYVTSHTLGRNDGGFLKICHYLDSR